MADTAISSEEEKKEYFDSPQELDRKVEQLAQWILQANHFTAFTGAGISTASGIPDYRSGANTVLPTGAGCWEKQANISKARKEGTLKHAPATKADLRVKLSSAFPSKCHMAMVALMEKDLLKFVMSQNVDGLHRKSGIPSYKISELHGNTNLEICQKCDKDYMRDFRTRNAQHVKDHRTGRKCDDPTCRGELHDSIINFGENLKEDVLANAENQSLHSDLMLAMGSSLRVTPAADLPRQMAQMGGKLVIVNLQKTPLDHLARLVIHAKIDDMIELLMKKLNMDIPEFRINRWVDIYMTSGQKPEVCVSGIDPSGGPFDLFKSVSINGKPGNKVALSTAADLSSPDVQVKLKFQGHYNEQDLTLHVSKELFAVSENNIRVNLIGDPFFKGASGLTCRWEVALAHDFSMNNLLSPIEFTQAEVKKEASGAGSPVRKPGAQSTAGTKPARSPQRPLPFSHHFEGNGFDMSKMQEELNRISKPKPGNKKK